MSVHQVISTSLEVWHWLLGELDDKVRGLSPKRFMSSSLEDYSAFLTEAWQHLNLQGFFVHNAARRLTQHLPTLVAHIFDRTIVELV